VVSAPPGVPQLPRTPRTTHTGVGARRLGSHSAVLAVGVLTLALVSNDEAPDTQLFVRLLRGRQAARKISPSDARSYRHQQPARRCETLVWWAP
jgi:hypothetical protein